MCGCGCLLCFGGLCVGVLVGVCVCGVSLLVSWSVSMDHEGGLWLCKKYRSVVFLSPFRLGFEALTPTSQRVHTRPEHDVKRLP